MSAENIKKAETEHHTSIGGFVIKKIIPFIEMRWAMFTFSGLVILAGIVIYIIRGGFDMGIDFKGGVKVEVQINQPNVTIKDVRKVFLDAKKEADINTVGDPSERHFMITFPTLIETTSSDEISQISDFLKKSFGEDKVDIKGSEKVDARMGKDFANRAFGLVLVTAAMILVYLIFRFDFYFGMGAVVSLFHDVLFMLSFAILFKIPIDLTVIAALLTILGYSSNDTIVVFDRIRELSKNNPNENLQFVMDKSITQTLSRTIITSLTVLFVSIVLFVWGGNVLHNFAFILIVGVIDGTYSSIYIASPITYMLKETFDKKSKRAKLATSKTASN